MSPAFWFTALVGSAGVALTILLLHQGDPVAIKVDILSWAVALGVVGTVDAFKARAKQ